MKKFLLFAAGLLMTLAACQKTELTGPAGDGLQSITVTVPQGVSTKASGDGTQVNRCILEIYRDGVLYGERNTASVIGGKATFDLRLVPGQTYDFVFWADKAEGTSPTDFADLHYTTSDLSAISVNGDYVGNNDEFDAFTYCEKDYKVTAAFNLAVTLKRPFGQLNVITKDLDDIKDDTLKPTDAKVVFKSVPTSFNARTGEVSDYQSLEYQTAVADAANGLLTVDYILAAPGEASLIDFSMTFFNNGAEICTNDAFTNIPLRRNYRTNVSGNLLTKKGTISVSINPEFETPDIEQEIETVTSIEDIPGALESGSTNIVVTEAPSAPADVVIPDCAEEISIALPATAVAVTFKYEDQSTVHPATVNVSAPESEDLIINLPNSTVTLNGQNYNNVTSTTAANTLIIAEDVTVNNLTVKAGNVKVYGKVVNIVSKPADVLVSLHVTTAERLAYYAANETAKFKKVVIENDIDFKGGLFKIEDVRNVEIDGQGHRISNFKVENEQKAGFVCNAVSVTFRNLTLENAEVKAVNDGKGNAYAGTFIGRSYGSIVFDNCVALNSSVEGVNKVGGLIGFVAENHVEATGSKVIGCTVSNTDVPDESGQIGGFAGYLGNRNYTCSFTNCSVENTTINAYMNREDRTISKFIGCFEGKNETDILSIDNCSVKDVTLNGMNEMAQSFVSTYGDLLGGQRYGNGQVTIKNSPLVYSIAYPAQLRKLAEMANADKGKKYFSNATVQLDADIDLAGENWTPVNMFSASKFVFDGKGHKIVNLSSIHKQSALKYGNGFFSNIVGGTVRNVIFENAVVKSGKFVSANGSGNVFGIVSGYTYGTVTFENVHVTGTGSQICGFGKVGGLIGMAADKGGVTRVVNCSVSDTKVECRYNGGGLIGLAQNKVEIEGSRTTNVKCVLDKAVKNQYVDLDTTLTDKDGNTVVVKGTYWKIDDVWHYAAWGDYYTDYNYSEATLASGGSIADGLCHNK